MSHDRRVHARRFPLYLVPLVFLLLGATPPAPPSYCVTNLGSLDDSTTRGYDINNLTEIVGESWVDGGVGFPYHPFAWVSGVMHDLGTLAPGREATANRINQYGWIVLTAKDASGVDQAYYTSTYPGTIWRPVFHPGTSGQAWGINDNIQMVGTFWQQGDPHAYVYHQRFPLVDLSQVDGTGRSEAYTINNVPQAGGTSWDLLSDCGTPGLNVPMIWEEDGFATGNWSVTVLPTGGRCRGKVIEINESGVAVGFTETYVFPTPVVWHETDSGWVIEFLPTPTGSDIGAALDVNESGQIVGYTDSANLWQNGVRYDLDTLVNAPAWDLVSASGINDQGQIVGTGYYNGDIRAFLLTPLPPGAACFQPGEEKGSVVGAVSR